MSSKFDYTKENSTGKCYSRSQKILSKSQFAGYISDNMTYILRKIKKELSVNNQLNNRVSLSRLMIVHFH